MNKNSWPQGGVFTSKDSQIITLEAEVERLRAENATLRDQASRGEEYRIDAIRSREGSERAHRRIDEAEARLREVVEAVHVVLPVVMDALESDADLPKRRAAFESIQELYEESTPFGAALAATQAQE